MVLDRIVLFDHPAWARNDPRRNHYIAIGEPNKENQAICLQILRERRGDCVSEILLQTRLPNTIRWHGIGLVFERIRALEA